MKSKKRFKSQLNIKQKKIQRTGKPVYKKKYHNQYESSESSDINDDKIWESDDLSY